MAITKITSGGITADAIDGTKIADDAIDSIHYAAASIDNEHLADDAVGVAELSATGTASSSTFLRGDNSWATAGSTSASDLTSGTLPIARIANDAIDSIHYAAASIDNEHLADDAVGVAELSATGTASSSTFLRGDNTWGTPIGGVTSVNSVTGAITAANIATAVEAASDSNTFTDADHTKLNAITASANLYVHPNHSGDVVSAADGAMTIQTDAVDIAMLSATGSAGATTFLRGDNSWVVPTDTNTVYTHPNHSGDVVSAADGAMTIQTDAVDIAMLSATGSAGATTFLRGDNSWVVPTDTNTVYTHPTTAGNKHIPTSGSSGQFLKYDSSGTAVWATPSYTTLSDSVTSTSTTVGASSAAAKSAYDNVPSHSHSYQAADADLLAIGGLTGTSGYLKKTAADTWTLDTSTFNNYSHPTSYAGDDFSIDTTALTGAVVVSDIDINVTTDTSGHVTDANGTVSTRTLTLANLGYTGSATANNYSHPTSYDGDDFSIDTTALTGAVVVSDIDINVTTDTSGHVTDANGTVSTRTLTLANLGYTGSATANNYSHPTTDGNKHVPTGGSSGQFLKFSSSGTATWATPSYTTNTHRSISDSTSTTSSTVSASQTAVKSAYDKGNHSHPYAASSHTHSYVSDTGDSMTGTLTITKDADALFIKTSTNAAGAEIAFSDNVSAYSQIGRITFEHSDTYSYGSGSVFTLGSTEATTTILADGKLMYGEGIYSKPGSGTGAGTRKDSNWDTAYTHSQATHAPSGAEANRSISNSVTSTSSTVSASSAAAKSAYDRSWPNTEYDSSDFLPASGGTLTGPIYFDRAGGEVLWYAEDSGTTNSIYCNVNDGQGNFGLMLGVDGAGASTNSSDGVAKLLFSGHGTDGIASLNAAQVGASVSFSAGLIVDSNDNTVRVGASSDTVGLNSNAGTKIADMSGNLFSGGTAVSVSGHTHSYLPLTGGTLTGSLNNTTLTADGQKDITLFGADQGSAQSGAFHNKLEIKGGSSQSRNLELYQVDSGYATIGTSWSANYLDIHANFDRVRFNQKAYIGGNELWNDSGTINAARYTNTTYGSSDFLPASGGTVTGNMIQLDGSPEYHFATTSASHSNWRIAAQELVSNAFEISSGTATAGTNANSDTYTPIIVAKTGGYVEMTGASQVRLTLGSQGTAGTNNCNWIRGNAGYLQFNAASSGYTWESGGTERMTLTSGGNLSMDGTCTWSGGGSANANTAYGWGNHASGGYLTSAFIEDKGSYTSDLDSLTASSDEGYYSWASTQPTNSPGWTYGGVFVLRDNSQNSQLAIGGSGNGNQRLALRRADSGSYGDWTEFHSTADFSSTNVSNWNTAYGWGNHASAGYTTNTGDITGVTAGTGMSGGGTSGTVTLTNSSPNIVQTTISGNAFSASSLQQHQNNANPNNLNTLPWGKTSNYASTGYWSNGPSGMSYGSVYNFGGYSGTSSLALQLAADVTHNSSSSTKDLWFRTGNNLGFQADWRKVWNSGNDGSGSGLDADTLDGQQGSYYASAASLANYSPTTHTHSYGDITNVAVTSPITGGGTSGSVTISHSTAAGNKHIPTGGNANQYLKYSSSGTATWSTITGSDASILLEDITDVSMVGQNVLVGTYPAFPDRTTGDFNTGLGQNIFEEITTGSANIAIGASSCEDLTTGQDNVAIGLNAGTANQTGSGNVYLGLAAGFSSGTNGDGSLNVAIGVSAQYTNGCNNAISIGYQSNYTGLSDYGVAVGYQSAKYSKGSNNINIGYHAGYGNTSYSPYSNVNIGTYAGGYVRGNYNVAVGYYAQRYAYWSDYSTAVGSYAMRNGSADSNTAIGYKAGYSTTGVANTFLGRDAGYSTITTTSGTYNTILGAYAGGSSSTASNEFTLGNNAVSNLRCNDTSISSLSDQRDKAEILDLPDEAGLDLINSLRPVTFYWDRREWYDSGVTPDGSKIKRDYRSWKSNSGQRQGFIAQEVEVAISGHKSLEDSQVVNGTADKKEFAPQHLLTNAIKAIQQLSAENTALIARIEALENN